MAANIYVYSSTDDSTMSRLALEEELDVFFGDAAENMGGGSGLKGFNLDYELKSDEDLNLWADRLRTFLRKLGVSQSTVFEVFEDGWKPGMPKRRVEVFGRDDWVTT